MAEPTERERAAESAIADLMAGGLEREEAVAAYIAGLKPRRNPMDWGALQGREPPPRVWLIEHWLATGPTLLAGPGGAGKSLVAQTLGTALVLGRPFLDAVHAPHNVLTWACEDEHDEIWRRQAAICGYFGTDIGTLPAGYVIEQRLGRDNALCFSEFGHLRPTPLLLELREQINDYKSDVVILDNIGQIFGGNENDRHHVTQFVNSLIGLCERPFALILLGHPAKTAGSEYSGSTAWQNAVRMRWFLGEKLPDQQQADDDEEADPDVRYVAKRKANYTAQDYRKLMWRGGLYVPEGVLPRFDAKYGNVARKALAEDEVKRALATFAAKEVRVAQGQRSGDYLPRLMVRTGMANGFTERELRDAMLRLLVAGSIKEVQIGITPKRMPLMSLRLITQ